MATQNKWRLDQEAETKRLDFVLLSLLPDITRSQAQRLIKQRLVRVNEQPIQQPKHLCQPNDIIELLSNPETTQPSWTAEPGTLDIIYEDNALLVINKPAGLVMHPGAGQPNQTLLNYLLYHAPNNHHLPRAGIVHRLDKDTSGLCVIAKTPSSYQHLVNALKERHVSRRYQAIVHGQLYFPETIDAPIGRHAHKRTHMAVQWSEGKPAITHVTPLEQFTYHSLLDLRLETGRTHQIRVHLCHHGNPILGDPTYGQQQRSYPQLSPSTNQACRNQSRQCLHAYSLGFTHPTTHQPLEFHSPLANDMTVLLEKLRNG